MLFDFVSFIPRAVVQGIPLLYGSTPSRRKPSSNSRFRSRWAEKMFSSATGTTNRSRTEEASRD